MTDDVRAILVNLASQPTTLEVKAKGIDYVPGVSDAQDENFADEIYEQRLWDETDTIYNEGEQDGQIMLARKICQYSGIQYQVEAGYVELYDPITWDPTKDNA